MAQQENQLHQVQFCCSICLDLFKDPVTIPCGHNYCMNCIKDFWNGDEQKKIPSCPQCRQTFTPRPVLGKNTMLAALVEQLKKTGLQAAPADHCYAGPEDVGCDVCSGRKLKAIKSCLVCLVSYCDKHLQPHYDVAPLRKHQLVEPSKNLQDNICSHHDEVMKMFCRTDQTCICYLCSVDEHKGHDTVSAAAERTERQRELEVKLQKIPEIIQKKEEEVKFYQKEVETICHSADEAVEGCEKIFTELICLIQKRSSDVKKHIRSNQKIRVSQAETRQKKLQKDITELKSQEAELKCLSRTEDHIHFLQKYSPPPLFSFPFLFFERPKSFDAQYLEDVNAAASEAVCTVQEILDDSKLKISLKEAEVDNLPSTHPAEPKKREEFLQYSKKISLDSNSANKHLSLHEQKVIKTEKEQRYVENSERFDSYGQVLSRGSLTGRSYWEVEMTGRCTAAVSYAGICRKGPFSDCRFGLVDSSWALERCQLMYSFRHNNTLTIISGPRSSRVGVYLDHQAGVLSFYSVSETMTLLHRVQTTFTQPLYAGLGLYKTGDQAEFCKPK